MKDRKDTAAASVAASTSSTLNDDQDRRDASAENVSQRGTQLGLKTSKSGFPLAKAGVLGRATERAGSAFRRVTTAPKSEAGPIADRPAAATSAPAAKSKAASRLISPPHLKSVHKAAKAFENFSLSKFPKDKVPENYIDPRNVHDPKAVQDAQKELIRRQLKQLPATDPRNSGVTITFPVAKLDEVKEALPGISKQGGEVKIDDLLTYLRRGMNGTTFYSGGNPAMKRLTTAMQARSQARAIIERIKNKSSAHAHVPEKKGGSKA